MSGSMLASRLVYLFVFSGCFYYLVRGLDFRTKRLPAMAVLAAALYLLYVPTDSTLVNSLLRYAVFAAVFTVWSRIFLKIHKSYALYLSVFYTIFMGVWFSCVQMLFSAWNIVSSPLLICATGFCRVASIVIVKKFFIQIRGDRTLTLHEIMLSLFPAAACFIANLVLFDYLNSGQNAMTSGYRTLIHVLVLFFGFSALLVLVSSERYFQMNRYKEENQRARQQLHAQYELFLREQANSERIKAIHHDMRNHLQTLEAMTGSAEAQEYISELKRSVLDTEPPFHTGSHTLDTLLTLKKEECDRRGIELTCLVHLSRADVLTPMELCTVFGNCLDNAIEAVSAPEVSHPYIHLSGGEVNGNMVIRVENPYAHALCPGLSTTKEREELHGYGLVNLRQVIEQKGGTVAFRTENGLFTVIWSIPFSET